MAKALNAAERSLLSPIFGVGSTGALTLTFDSTHLEQHDANRAGCCSTSAIRAPVLASAAVIPTSKDHTVEESRGRSSAFSGGPFVACTLSLLDGYSLAEGKPLGFLNPWLHDDDPVVLNHTTRGSNPGANPDSFSAFTGWVPLRAVVPDMKASDVLSNARPSLNPAEGPFSPGQRQGADAHVGHRASILEPQEYLRSSSRKAHSGKVVGRMAHLRPAYEDSCTAAAPDLAGSPSTTESELAQGYAAFKDAQPSWRAT
ncbi:hypothetical protein EDB89DRAFT_2070361 [Lactarius sanguifluus]|nr:hypothetical protein EDB89DRAFT_2070361 [Lactarius sanguifluus]